MAEQNILTATLEQNADRVFEQLYGGVIRRFSQRPGGQPPLQLGHAGGQ